MSQFQLTPMSIIDNTALGGFRAGMADERSLLHSDSSLETERLAQEQTRQANELSMLKRPMELAEFAKKQAQAEADLGMVRSGDYERGQKADIDLKVANAIGKMDENERKRLQDKMDGILAVNEMMSGKTPAYLQANWPDIVAEADARGIKNFPRTWTPEVAAQMDAKARMAWRTAQVIANERAATTAYDRSVELEGKKHEYGMAKQADQQRFTASESAKQRANAIAVANIRAQDNGGGLSDKVGGLAEITRQKLAALDAGKIKPEDISVGELENLSQDIQTKREKVIDQQLWARLLQAEAAATKDPAAQARLTELKRQAYGDQFVRVDAELKLRRGKGATLNPPTAQAGGTTSPTTPSPGTPAHKTDWMARAKAKNPSYSDADIETAYRNKFGK